MTRDREEQGFTLLEMTVTFVLLTGMIITMVQIVKASADAQRQFTIQGRAIEITQDILDQMRMELLSSVKVFENDGTGPAYRALLDMSQATPSIQDYLPTATQHTSFGLETATSARTGNSLMFARHAWTDEYTCLSGITYRTDVHRMVRYYLAEEDGGPSPDHAIGLNLCHWVSEPMADGDQIDDITDPVDQQEVLLHMRTGTPADSGVSHSPLEVVWILGADPANADTLRHLNLGGNIADTPFTPRGPSWSLLQDQELTSPGLLFYRHFSVASNYSHEGMGVGRYSVSTLAQDGYPHGFEVQLIGPTTSRLVLLQLCVVSTNRQGLSVFSNLRNTVQARDI